MAVKLIVGCGNPGETYEDTRHNIGFKCVEYASEFYECPLNIEKKKSMFGKKMINNNEVIFLKPQTFVIHSGEAVLYIASFLKVSVKDILVIYDDIDLPFGKVSISLANTKIVNHSAIVSLTNSLINNSFVLCATGIGPLKSTQDEEDFYLGKFPPKQTLRLPEIYAKVQKEIDNFITKQ